MVTRNRGQKSSRRPNRNQGNGSQRQSRNSNSGKEDDDDDDPDDDDNQNSDDDDDDQDDEPEFTQADIDEIVQREKGKAGRQANRKLLKSLGFDDFDSLKAALEAKVTPPAAKKKTGTDDKDDKDDDEVDVEKIRSEAKKEADRRVKALELDGKIKDIIADEYDVSRKQADRLRKMVEVDDDADEDEIHDALDDLEKEFPDLFVRREEERDDDDDDDAAMGKRSPRRDRDRDRRPASNPGRGPRRRRGTGADPKTAARTLLHERHPQTANKSK